MSVGIFWLVMGGGGWLWNILAGGGWLWVVVDTFWLSVGYVSRYFLAGGGCWWVVVDIFWLVVVGVGWRWLVTQFSLTHSYTLPFNISSNIQTSYSQLSKIFWLKIFSNFICFGYFVFCFLLRQSLFGEHLMCFLPRFCIVNFCKYKLS